MDRSTAHYAKTDYSDAEQRQSARLRDCRNRRSEKAVRRGARCGKKSPHNLPRIVDAVGVRTGGAEHVDLGEVSARVEKAVSHTRAVEKSPDDLPSVVDAEGGRIGGAGHVNLSEAPAGIEEAVPACAVAKISDNLPQIVDAEGIRTGGTSI